MDAVKTQLLRIQEQLGGLTISQKMLTASLVAIMIMTILWWGRYAGTAEMEPVLDQSIPAVEMGRIKAMLDSKGISAHIVGDRVLVPADRKMEAFVTLAYSDALPSDSAGAWDEMFKQMSPWDSQNKTNAIQNHFRERMIAQGIKSFIPGVANANVIINPTSERRVGGNIEPSASVQITTRNNGRDIKLKQLVDAAASTVASAVSGLSKSRIAVVIDGVPRKAHEPNEIVGGDLYEQIEQLEKSKTEKALGILPAGSLVAVSVDLDITSSQEKEEFFDPARTFAKDRLTDTNTEENQQPQPQATEPGALPNTGLVIGSAAAQGGATSTVEKSRVESEIFPSKTTKTINRPAGKLTVMSAAIRIPRSYFVLKYKTASPTAKDPDDAALQPLVDAEAAATRKDIQNTLSISDENRISVGMFSESVPMLAAGVSGGGGETSTGSGLGAMVGGHMKEVILGALAVVSLFMVSSMVRKGSMPVPVAVETGPREAQHLGAAEAVAGIVGGDGNTTLDGMELDEESVKAQQMVEQVSTMVKENPDAAANLVKRWLNQS